MRKQGSKKLLRIIQKTKQNGQSPSLTLTTLNANRLDSVIKRHRSAERIKKKKQDPTIHCLQKTHFIPKKDI